MRRDELLARLPSYALTNRFFTFACTALPAALGSVVSFVFHSGAIVCVIEVISGQYPLNRDPAMLRLAAALYAFVGVNIVSTLVNSGPSHFMTLMSVIALLGFPFSYSIWSISRKEDIAVAAIAGSALSCYAAAILALIQFSFLGMRAEGGAGNALVFATVTCLATATVLAGAFYLERKRLPLLLGAYGAGGVALLYSGSRLAWAALFISTLIILFVHRREILARFSTATLWTALGVAMVALMLASIPAAGRFHALLEDWTNLYSKGDYSTSLGVRAALWQIGVDKFLEAPLLGHGQAQSMELIAKEFRDRFGLTQSFTHFHNGFLTAAVELGVLGLGALLAVFMLAFKNGVDALRGEPSPEEIFGALVLLTGASIYVTIGSANLMLGHDILDTMFLVTMVLGTYLGSGRSLLAEKAVGEPTQASPA